MYILGSKGRDIGDKIKINLMKPIPLLVLSTGSSLISLSFGLCIIESAFSLPPPEETPEEVLRTEIIIEARSPIDGKLLDAAEYAELQAQLQASPNPQLSSKVKETIFLIRFRKLIRTVLPFLPI